MTAKESKAVAWQVRHFYDENWGGWYSTSQNYHLLYGDADNNETRALVPESALHAAEAELGELRRRVGELADSWDAEAVKARSLAARQEKRGDYENANVSIAASHDAEAYAHELRQLLASDGGADGDNTNEVRK